MAIYTILVKYVKVICPPEFNGTTYTFGKVWVKVSGRVGSRFGADLEKTPEILDYMYILSPFSRHLMTVARLAGHSMVIGGRFPGVEIEFSCAGFDERPLELAMEMWP
jgi:hypothetical protein